jgi:phage gp16-like protein
LNTMQREFQDEPDKTMRVGRSEFCTLIKAYLKSGLDNAGEKADLLLEKVNQQDPSLLEDASVLALLKKVWVKNSHHPKAKERIAELDAEIAKRGEMRKNGDRGKRKAAPSSPEEAENLLDWKNVLETVNHV